MESGMKVDPKIKNIGEKKSTADPKLAEEAQEEWSEEYCEDSQAPTRQNVSRVVDTQIAACEANGQTNGQYHQTDGKRQSHGYWQSDGEGPCGMARRTAEPVRSLDERDDAYGEIWPGSGEGPLHDLAEEKGKGQGKGRHELGTSQIAGETQGDSSGQNDGHRRITQPSEGTNHPVQPCHTTRDDGVQKPLVVLTQS